MMEREYLIGSLISLLSDEDIENIAATAKSYKQFKQQTGQELEHSVLFNAYIQRRTIDEG